MALPNELQHIFQQRNKSYKMVLVMALLSEMNVTGRREVSFPNVRDRFLALLRDRESQGKVVDPPPSGKASWADIITPIETLSSILDYLPHQQTIGIKAELYNSWPENVLSELYDFATQELDQYYLQKSDSFSLHNALRGVMERYLLAKEENFASHPIGEFVRQTIPQGIRKLPFINEHFKVRASVGMSKWVTIPWIAIMDERITTTTQHGEYIVYLFSEDMQRVYLTLAQGVTSPIQDKGKAAGYQYLRDKVNEIRSYIPLEKLNKDENIYLTSGGLGQDYQVSTVAYYKYELNNMPSDSHLIADLKYLVENYNLYVEMQLGTSNTKPAFQFTMARLHYGQGILHYLRNRSNVTLNELIQNQSIVLRTGDDVKHPRERIMHIARALRELGLITIEQNVYNLTQLGQGYAGLFGLGIWELSDEQAKMLRDYIKHNYGKTSLLNSIQIASEIVNRLGTFATQDFMHEFIGMLSETEDWNEVTKTNRSRFMLGWLEDLQIIRKDGNQYIANEANGVKPVVENLSEIERINRIKQYIANNGFMYPSHLIENFYLSLKTKPFVILAGVSGTGKTKLVKLFAEAIEATSANKQFTLIPVRPDWSDPSDLIGYKDLSGSFRPGPVTEVLVTASQPENRSKPYFICLDEMNLARVEHYFSDMLSVLETQAWKGESIVTDALISDVALQSEPDKQRYGNLSIPDNVYFIGTVNMDETTHPFSKKVLDRANTIEFNEINLLQFPEATIAEAAKAEAPNAFLRADFLQLVEVYSEYKTLVEDTSKELARINTILESIHSHVGFRIRDAVCFYLIYNERFGLMAADEAFDLQLLQKILPRIQGSNLAVKRVVLQLLEIALKRKLPIESLIDDASDLYSKMEDDLKTAKYPQSARKLSFMLRRLEEDGFTSYWLS